MADVDAAANNTIARALSAMTVRVRTVNSIAERRAAVGTHRRRSLHREALREDAFGITHAATDGDVILTAPVIGSNERDDRPDDNRPEHQHHERHCDPGPGAPSVVPSRHHGNYLLPSTLIATDSRHQGPRALPGLPTGTRVVGGRFPRRFHSYPRGYRVGFPEEDAMELPNDVVDDVRKRLRRAAGQVQAVERMLAEGRECREVVTQLSAATKALEQAGFKIIAAGLTYCIENPEEAEANGYPLETVERMFMKLAR